MGNYSMLFKFGNYSFRPECLNMSLAILKGFYTFAIFSKLENMKKTQQKTSTSFMLMILNPAE